MRALGLCQDYDLQTDTYLIQQDRSLANIYFKQKHSQNVDT